MIEIIQNALLAEGIHTWAIEHVSVRTAELFFIRKKLDTRRMKETEKYTVTVYRDFEADGKPMRGSSSVTFIPTESPEQVAASLKSAFFAAGLVENPSYELPSGAAAVIEEPAALTPEDAALAMADAIFAADAGDRAFVNSAEIFAVEAHVHLITSGGTDVSYPRRELNGEFVTQCRAPLDVELHNTFRYRTADTAALTKKVEDALRRVADRSVAEAALPTGTYTVLLSDENLRELLTYYISRTHVSTVYPGYSNWKLGDTVQCGEGNGETLSLTLKATVPFSSEGIPMVDRPVLKDGVVCTYHGGARLSSYLGVEPTGEYRAFTCDSGKTSVEDMKAEPYLYPVVFSDFQMDAMTGHFGGEIRLAYWFDGETTRIVTGGSINGSIGECSSNLQLSKETYTSLGYEGPSMVRLHGVRVAGI